MSIQFLSEDYVAAADDALGSHAGFASAIAGVDLTLQFRVTDPPSGDDIGFYIAIADGSASASGGEADGADVTVTSSYETAVGIFSGELNTQMAFMTGKLKVAGDLAKLMLNQNVINEMTKAMGEIDAEY